ncbi:IS21 family transposase, partial [Lacimonas salitolerans]
MNAAIAALSKVPVTLSQIRALQPVRSAVNNLLRVSSSSRPCVCGHAGHHVSLRAYADRLVMIANDEIIAEHKRRFTRNISYFEPWHYVPLLDRKPGALRDGAPFVGWELP